MTAAYDINEVAVLGIAQALRNAAERWEAAGAPCPSDEQRERIRAFVKQETPDAGQARETYRYLVHWTEEAKFEADRLARAEAQDRMRAERRAKKEAMTAEMKAIRESLGLSQSEMNDYLGLKPGVVNNAENAGATYGIDFLESMLRRYRVEAKLRADG